jgi:hypothetical protein
MKYYAYCFILIKAVALVRYVTGFKISHGRMNILSIRNRPCIRDFVLRLLNSTSGASPSSSHVRAEATTTSTGDALVGVVVPRLETLQKLLSYCGAPGSIGCTLGDSDMISTTHAFREELHPYLRPISQSQSTGNYICAYQQRVGGSEDNMSPIVESGINFPGMKLLALNRFVVRLVVTIHPVCLTLKRFAFSVYPFIPSVSGPFHLKTKTNKQ